jgi:hypothetical protein
VQRGGDRGLAPTVLAEERHGAVTLGDDAGVDDRKPRWCSSERRAKRQAKQAPRLRAPVNDDLPAVSNEEGSHLLWKWQASSAVARSQFPKHRGALEGPHFPQPDRNIRGADREADSGDHLGQG